MSGGEQGAGGMQARVDQLAKLFMARLPTRLDSIDEAFCQCRAGGVGAGEAPWLELHRLLHSLGGAAGTFGVPAIGTEARRIEATIQDHVQAGPAPAAAVLDTIAIALAGLRAMAPPSDPLTQ